MNKIIILGLIISIAYCAIDADLVPASLTDVKSIYDKAWYSGNLAVSEENKLHYWFFPVNPDNTDAPLLVWLNSGPGCSGLVGATGGNGPFTFSDKSTVNVFNKNENSWNIHANMLYIDAPGVGYSVGPEDHEPYTDNETVS